MKNIFSLITLLAIATNLLGQISAGTIGSNHSVCSGSGHQTITNISNPTAGRPITWWYKYHSDGVTRAVNVGANGQLELTYAISTITITGTTSFWRGVSDMVGNIIFSNEVIVSVIDPSTQTPGSIGSNQTICYGATPALLTNQQSPVGYASVNWQRDGGERWSNITGADGLTYQPPALTESQTYRRRVITNCGETKYSNEITVTVSNALNGGAISGNRDICYGSTPSGFSDLSSPSGGKGTWSYSWEESSNGSTWSSISGANGLTFAPPAQTATKYFKRKSTNDCGSAFSNTLTVTVSQQSVGGAITGNQTICKNATPSLITSSTPGSLGLKNVSLGYFYQWEFSTDNGVSWTSISSTNSLTYQPPALSVTTQYRRKYVPDCEVAYSNVVTITVANDPVGGAVGSNQEICYNATPALLTNVTDPSNGIGSFSWQWQSSTNGTDYSDIGSATSKTYQPPALTTTTHFRRKETNQCGTVYSNAVTITVNPPVTVGSIAADQTICPNAAANTLTSQTLPGGGRGAWGYQWQVSSSGTGGWSDISGQTNTTFNPGVIGTSTRYFRRRETNTCATDQASNIITITVTPSVSGGTIASNQSICFNFTPNNLTDEVSPSGGMGTWSYAWFSSASSSGPWDPIQNATGLTYQPPALTARTFYYRRATNTCGIGSSNTVEIQVASTVDGGTISGTQSICYNTAPALLSNVTAASGGKGTKTYAWYVSDNGTTGWSAISNTNSQSYQPPALTSTKYYKRQVNDSDCGPAFSNTIYVTVHPQMVAGSVGSNQIICYNTAPNQLTNISLPNGGSGTWGMQWQSSTSGTGSWNNINGETGQNLSLSAMQTTLYYRRLETNQVCGTINSNTITIEVLPDVLPGTVEANQNICYNAAPTTLSNITAPSGGSGNFSLAWQQSPNGTDSWSDIESTNSLSYSPPSLTTTSYFRRKAVNTCKTVYTSPITITVAPQVNFGAISGSQTICYNTTPSTISSVSTPSGGIGAWAYSWSYSENGSDWFSVSGQNGATLSPDALSTTTQFRRNETNQCGSSSSTPVTVTVAPDCVPGVIGSDQIICYNASPNAITNITLPQNGIGTWNFQWQNSTTGTGGWQDINGETSPDISLGQMTSTLYFRRKEVNSCKTVYSNTVQITVLPNVLPGTIESNQSICYSQTPAQLNSTTLPSGGTGSFQYFWQQSLSGTDSWSDIPDATNLNFAPSPLTQTTYFRRKEVNSCKTVYTPSVKITVGADLASGVIGSHQDICNNTAPQPLTNITNPSGGLNDFSFLWQSSGDGITWDDLSGHTNPSYSPGQLSATTYFRRKEINQCGNVFSNHILVSVANPVTGGTIGENQEVCSGYAPNQLYNVQTPSGGVGAWSYSWAVSPNGTGNWSTINGETSTVLNPAPASALRYIKRIETNQCGVTESNAVTLSIRGTYNGGTVGYSQTLCFGVLPQMISEVVTPSGGSGGYEFLWQKSDNAQDWEDIPSFTGPVYYPPSNGKLTYYRRKLTEFCGETFSNTVIIDIKAQITGGLIGSTQELCPGETPAKLTSVDLPSGGLNTYTYIWQRAIGTSDEWNDINGAINTEFTPSAFSSGSRRFRRKVFDGCGVGYSNEVTITINEALSPGIIGTDQTVCFGSIPEAIFSATDPSGWEGDYTFEWMVSDNGTDNWTKIENQSSASLVLGLHNKTKFYRRDVSYRCGKASSNVVKITVKDQFIPGSITPTQTICFGQKPAPINSITLPSGGYSQNTFKWFKKDDTGQWVEIPFANLSSFNPDTLYATSYYKRLDINDCGSEYTNICTINVAGEFKPGRIGSDQSILFGETPAELKGLDEPSGGEGSYSFQWRFSTDSITWNNVVNATNEHYQPGSLTETTFFRRRTTSQYCGEKITNPVKITVSPDLTPGSISGDQTICFNGVPSALTESVAPSGGNNTYTFSWLQSLDGSTWNDISNASGSAYQPPALTQTTHYRRRVTCGSLLKLSSPVLVQVHPHIVAPTTNENDLYCKGSLVKVDVTNNTGYSHTWYNSSMVQVNQGSVFYVENIQADALYFVKSSNSDNCSSSLSEVNLFVDNIAATFSHNAVGNNVFEGTKIDFLATDPTAVKWLWDFGMGETFSTQNPSIYFSFPGSYQVYLKVWSSLNCADDTLLANAISVLPVQTHAGNSTANPISIFPNPFSNLLVVKGLNIEGIQIFNSKGSLIASDYTKGDLVTIDLHSVPIGIYLVRVFANGHFSTFKTIKE